VFSSRVLLDDAGATLPEAMGILARLRGRGLHLAAFSTLDEVERVEATVGFEVDAVLTNGTGAIGLPKTLFTCCRALGIGPAAALVVGTEAEEAVAAGRLGARFVGVGMSGFQGAPRLSDVLARV
jgi:phosphoglycolate phosphatase-like HAD superfamily hydrolase